MEKQAYKILVADDEKEIRDILKLLLSEEGYEVVEAENGKAAVDLAGEDVSLYILDVNMPVMSGFAAGAQIRKRYDAPMMYLTAYSGEADMEIGFSAGADDYMVKPVRYSELLARADAIIRRSRQRTASPQNGIRTFRSFTMDTIHHRILRDGQEVDLSSIEYALLLYMTDHPDTLLLYHDLYKNVWDNDSLGDIRTVMVHISNLRKKLDPDHRKIISTVRGAGYIFSDV